MTSPAGNIGIGLSIDGSDISSKIAEAVQRHLRPVLAEIEHMLSRVQREYKDTARDAEQSGSRQSSAAKVVKDALERVSRQHAQNATIAAISSKEQRLAINNVTRAIQRQAAAYTQLAAARTAAAAAPDPAVSGGAFSGAGGGGPPTGGGGGGFRGRGRSGGARGLLVPGIANLAALAIGSFPTAALAVTNLTGAIQQLGQAGLVLPGVIGGIVTSVAALKLGMAGVGDAITDARAAIVAEDWEALDAVLKDLPVSTQQLVRVMAGPLADAGKALKENFQTFALENVGNQLQSLATRYMPLATKATETMGKAWNATFGEIIRVADKDSTRGFLDQLIGNTSEAQGRFNKAIEPLVNGIGKLVAESSDFLPRLADGLTAVATRFSNWIDKSVANGNLDRWIDAGLRGMASFGETLLNVGKIIASVTQAAGGDGGLLAAMERGTTKLAEFLASAEGQEKLTKFFADAREQMGKWLDVLRELTPILGSVYDAMKQWTDFALPVLTQIFDLLNNFPGAITGIVTAFLAWTSIRGVSTLLGMLTGVGKSLDDLPGKASRSAGGISGALSKIALPAALGGLLAGQTSGMIGPDNSVLSNLGGFGANVAGGAALGGMAGGPWGAALGAMIGAGVSLFEASRERLEKAKAEWLNKWEADRAAGPDRPGSRENQLAAVPALRGVQLPSLYNPNGTLKPTLGQDMAAKIAAGQLSGWTIGPDGTIMGPGGQVIPGARATPLLPSQVNPNITPPNLPQPPPRPVYGPKIGEGQPVFPETAKAVQDIATEIKKLPEGEVKIKDPSPEVIENLKQVDATITQVSENEIAVKANTEDAQVKLDALVRKYEQQVIRIRLQPTAGPMPALPTAPPRAGGGMVWPFSGVLPGYSPRVDNMLVPMGGGEGVVIPEAMRALGPRWLYNVNSAFRPGLPRSNYGFADGGVVGGVGALGGDPVIGLLTEIRDALMGRTAGPLSEVAQATGDIAAGDSAFGGQLWGGDLAKGFAAGVINEFGGDSRKMFPEFDRQGRPYGAAGTRGVLGAADFTGIAEALASFAKSGDLSTVSGLGLGANDPVITALVAARNKKKNGLSDEEIAALVGQVFGGGYTGVMDEANSPLIKSLTRYREKLAKGAGGGAGLASLDPATLMPGMTGGAGANGLISLAQAANGGKYEWGASDLAAGLADCSGAVSDLVEYLTTGSANSGRLFSTNDASEVLKSLGAQPGLVPGALQIGFNPEHMAATLPNGVNFEAGGSGGGIRYGNGAAGAGDSQFTEQWSLPAGLVSQMNNGMTSLGQDMCSCVGNGTGMIADGINGLIGGVGDGLANTVPGIADSVMQAVTGTGTGLPGAKTVHGAGDNPVTQLANLLGFKVTDGTIQGAGAAGQNLMRNEGPAVDATGRVFSDSAIQVDRTLTSMETANKARHTQVMDVLNQTRDLLTQKVLGPTMQAATTAGINGLSSSFQSAVGTAMGSAAGPMIGPPVAAAVRAAIPMAPTHDQGGDWPSGTYGLNMSGHTEKVLTGPQARLFDAGLLGGWNLLPQQQHQAGNVGTGNANASVGADFFGLGQVPIIGPLVSMLVQILLAVIGVNIELQNTLSDMTKEIRGFRGDFQAFDATGRVASDTSALTARTQTNTEVAEARRMRILKDVIIGAIKFVIEKLIVPIVQAVVQALISFAQQAVTMGVTAGINSIAPGAGQLGGAIAGAVGSAVGGVATAISNVAIEVVGKVLTEGLTVLVETIGDAIRGLFPGIISMISNITKQFGSLLTGLFKGLFQPFINLGRMIGGFFGGVFDQGGEAHGLGLMPKAVIEPERVLDPVQTRSFNRLIAMIDSGKIKIGGESGSSSSQVVIHAPFNVQGGEAGAREARDHLLELIPG